MHQPDYRDASGVMQMPWVFLHAIKDYYEMPWHVTRHRGVKVTFNVTPPLIEQLRLYEKEGIAADRFLTLAAEEPSALSRSEREYLEKICRSAPFDTMVKPLPGLVELYQKPHLDDRELTELIVLFLLAWCGNYVRRRDEVARLLAKGRGYDEADKKRLLAHLSDFIPEVIAIYRDLHEKGAISLATTPYNHPILPLLLDMQNAKRANPATKLPPNHFPMPEDAKAQVEKAIALYREVFGCDPTGFWPAEGAVDEKSVALYKAAGLRWIATDEAILFKSLGEEDRADLYKPYGFDDLFIAFRDHGLSDLIGFTYRYRKATDAAADFMGRLRKIADENPDALVSVILDGENAWEYYENNGYDFFEALYSALADSKWCETVRMDEIAENDFSPLPQLAPGSWINGNFDTWVGHPEKNAAWELIFQAKEDYRHHEAKLDAKKREAIEAQFLVAECSDWFWWYGVDHHTDFSKEFDTLFRNHLITIYRMMNIDPPAALFKPIAGDIKDLHALIIPPKFPITPIIDGKVSSFFEWIGAGRIDETRSFSTMDRVRGPVKTLLWGQDDRAIYLRLEGDTARLKKATIRLFMTSQESEKEIVLKPGDRRSRGVKSAIKDGMEIALKKSVIGYQSPFRLRIEVETSDGEVQVLPGMAELVIDPKEDYAADWFV